jgi:SAM-dependent methyltransferase
VPGTVDLTALVSLLSDRDRARSEADLQADVRTLLLYGGLNLDDPAVRLESPASNRRRIDVEVGSAVIELKKDLRLGNVRVEGAAQLASYMTDRTSALGRRYAGVLSDGCEWLLFSLDEAGAPVQVASFQVDSTAEASTDLCVWLEGVLATGTSISPTALEVRRRLGAGSSGFQLDLTDLHRLYEMSRDRSEVRLKRELWARLLTSALGTSFDDNQALFVEHTYLVMVAGLIAHSAVGIPVFDGLTSARGLLDGSLFRQIGISGVVEPDFFDWPALTAEGSGFVMTLAKRLGRFNWSDVDHDILKVLYESVIDRDTRFRLGEYYTPDWLAEKIVAEVVSEPLSQRVLDPACGSGTFVFWAVRRYLAAADEAGMSPGDGIAGVVGHVFGMDLHPVAVTLARVTYVLAIGRERLRGRRQFAVPIYLGDSIQVSQSASVASPHGMTVLTSDGSELFSPELHFPDGVIADPESFDRLVSELADRATRRLPGDPIPEITALLDRYRVAAADRVYVIESFRALCALYDDGRNHIWGYFVRNLARPLEFARPTSRVDCLVGNPPWLAARFMPQGMRAKFTSMSRDRGILTGHHAQRDLAGLFVARAVELYLKDSGAFGFVMPFATLSRGQYAGFRTGDFTNPGSVLHARFEAPWDLTGIDPEPFPVPCCVVLGTADRDLRSSCVSMPTDGVAWEGVIPGEAARWSEVEAELRIHDNFIAVASLVFASPYGDLFRTGAPLYPRVLLAVQDAPAPAIGMPVGRRMVESRRRAQENAPWRSMAPLRGSVEEEFIRPVHLGETMLPFRALEPQDFVLPVSDQGILAVDGDGLDTFPGLDDWWRSAEAAWLANARETNRLSLVEKINYVRALSSQFPIGSQRVVYSKAGSHLVSARVTDGRTLIENGLYWASVGSVSEGRYLTAILNSRVLGDLVRPYQARGLFGPRHFDKYIWLIPIPVFDSSAPAHLALVDLGEAGEATAVAVDVTGMGFQRARRRVRAALEAEGVADLLDAAVRELIS